VIDFEAALQLYRDHHYPEAAAAFSALAAAEADPGRAAVLHADAGTAAARSEQWGEALWQLNRARLLAPRDAVAAENLERVSVMAKHGQSEAEHFTQTVRELPLHLTLAEDQAACGAAAGLAFALLAARRVTLLSRVSGWLAAGLLVAAGAWWLASASAWHAATARAVIIPPTAVGRAEPDANSQELFRLSQGSLVSTDEERHGWRLVEAEGGARGWIADAEARPLR